MSSSLAAVQLETECEVVSETVTLAPIPPAAGTKGWAVRRTPKAATLSEGSAESQSPPAESSGSKSPPAESSRSKSPPAESSRSKSPPEEDTKARRQVRRFAQPLAGEDVWRG